MYGSDSLLRSDALDSITNDDVCILKSLNVTEIISFRSAKHADIGIQLTSKGFVFHLIPLPSGGFANEKDFKANIVSYYSDLFTHKTQICQILDILSRAKGRVLICCNGGQDRTGVVSIIVQKLIGLPDQIIFEDYMQSLRKEIGTGPFGKRVLRFIHSLSTEPQSSYMSCYRKHFSPSPIDVSSTATIKKIANFVFMPVGRYYRFSEFDAIELCVILLRVFDEYKNRKKQICKRGRSVTLLDNSKIGKRYQVVFKKHQNKIIIKSRLMEAPISLSLLRFLQKQIYSFLNSEYGLNKLDFKTLDSRYLQDVLGVDIPFITNISYEKCRLKSLRCFLEEDSAGKQIENSRYYLQLKTGNFQSLPHHHNNFIGESNKTRLMTIMDSIKKHGYGYNHRYLVVYNNEQIIRDGEHRAAILAWLYDNPEITILRIKFSRNYYYYQGYYSTIH